MSENREEILADFQACTGIDDIGEAFSHLDEAKWDLLAAINRVMPQDSQQLPSESSGLDIEMIEEIRRPQNIPNGQKSVVISPDFIEASTSHGRLSTRRLNFQINYNDRVIELVLPETATIRDLKTMIFSKLGVPVCHQTLTGWEHNPTSDYATLSLIKLPRENILFLTNLDSDNNGMDFESEENLTKTFTLNVFDEMKSKDYSLKYPGTKTIEEVKADIYSLTDIPVRHQVWTGWPSTLKDDTTTLAAAGLQLPNHSLSVKKNPAKEYKRIVVDLADSDSSVEEFEDASCSASWTGEDEMFVEDIGSRKVQPLIPDNVEDETAGCIHFTDEFTNRYGAMHPDFFPGTLEDAIKEACQKPARERRLLAVYLHHDASVLTNVFCTQLLCYESVLQLLATNFVVWGWDLTFESNKQKFLASLTRTLGPMAAVTVRNIEVERLPALLLIMRMRSATEIFSAVHGNVGVNELLTSLIQAVDVFSEQQKQEVKEEDERMAREMIKIEQDNAYQASLEIDRAKEEAKKQQEMLETREKQRIESEKQEEEAKKQAERAALESELPDEPSEDSTENITKIRFRLPKGDFLERRFLASSKLQVLLNYLVVQGFHTKDYKVISSWPRRDLTSVSGDATLQQLNLCPQETLILEER
ncbi:FAS-associated factor 1 [Macrosteles quadrilineatus]|uniref:FAS-associated factor 1 n=1 Tax=Macrosteles quadrilineatus TaxID=74068 RepID=UPI0023E1040F|nr:FAS-associated factor 1 [Macrosteles quadrilineatus]